MNYSLLNKIAVIIGHHFWNCENDEAARNCGIDCAKEIIKKIYEDEEMKKK